MIKNDVSFENALSTIKEFCKHAVSKINIEKTECMLLGSLKNTVLCDEIRDIKINREFVKCLVIFIGHNKGECY